MNWVNNGFQSTNEHRYAWISDGISSCNRRWIIMTVIVDRELCIGCGACVKICPEEAIRMLDNKAFIDYSKCSNCLKCIWVCPINALQQKITHVETNTLQIKQPDDLAVVHPASLDQVNTTSLIENAQSPRNLVREISDFLVTRILPLSLDSIARIMNFHNEHSAQNYRHRCRGHIKKRNHCERR